VKPIVGILCTTEEIPVVGWGELPHQAVFQEYINAVANFSDCLPILIPTAWQSIELIDAPISNITKRLNGIILPGAVSNIYSGLYSNSISHVGPKDTIRDKYALSLISAAIAANVPILGICRGMQEINVAFGGTLIASIHEHPGRKDHRSNKDIPFVERYLPSHNIILSEHSWLKQYLASKIVSNSKIPVNSLHSQGIGRLGKGLTVDAISEDGVIEAISYSDKKTNIIGVQWHPEWYIEESLVNQVIWEKFGENCFYNYAQKK
jgi:putative glutamine amidotransferase